MSCCNFPRVPILMLFMHLTAVHKWHFHNSELTCKYKLTVASTFTWPCSTLNNHEVGKRKADAGGEPETKH